MHHSLVTACLLLAPVAAADAAEGAAGAAVDAGAQPAGAASPEKGAPVALQGTARDFDTPPAGSAGDQSLWQAAYEANNRVTLVRATAARLQQRATAGQYLQRLEALGKGPGDGARRAETLRERLLAEWSRSFEIVAARQWPVDPTRACRYPMLSFESAMLLAEGPAKAPQLAGARTDLQECLERARLAIDAMARSNDAFQAAIAETEGLLSAPAAPAGGGAAAGEVRR